MLFRFSNDPNEDVLFRSMKVWKGRYFTQCEKHEVYFVRRNARDVFTSIKLSLTQRNVISVMFLRKKCDKYELK